MVHGPSRHRKIGQSSARSRLAAFHNFILKMSDAELHEITFNRAKEEPVPASFPGVVLLIYQNNLRSASTKITIYSMISGPGSRPRLRPPCRVGAGLVSVEAVTEPKFPNQNFLPRLQIPFNLAFDDAFMLTSLFG